MTEDYKLIVLHKLEDSFGVYNVRTGEMIKIINTGSFPHEICLSPDREKIYIAEMGVRGIESVGKGGNTISVFDVNSFRQISSISTGIYDRPHGLVCSSNRLYVTSESTKHLLVIDLESEKLIEAVYLGQDCAHMVNITHNGQAAYTANIWSNTVTGIDTTELKIIHHIVVPDRPEGMVFSKDDKLIYCVCREDECVAVIERYKGEMTEAITTGKGPVRIVMSPGGKRLYIPLFHSAAVDVADTDIKKVIRTIEVGSHPAGTCLSPDGKMLFISCEEENMVYIIDTTSFEIVNKIGTGNGADAMVCLNSNETEVK